MTRSWATAYRTWRKLGASVSS